MKHAAFSLLLIPLLVLGCSGKTETGPDIPIPEGNWLALGSGVNGTVDALIVYDGALVAGGTFTSAGDAEALGLATWNGSAWAPLGGGVSGGLGTVAAFAIYQGDLIVSGSFEKAGTTDARCIARWNGTSWSPLGAGLQGTYLPGLDTSVEALAVYNGELYAGGNFVQAGEAETRTNCIARWDGAQWSTAGQSPGPQDGLLFIGDLEVFGGALIAGGRFSLTDIEGGTTYHIAQWNGTAWSALGTGISRSTSVSALDVFGNSLVVGGNFQKAGATDARSIALWNGTTWSAMGRGVGGGASGGGPDVHALLSFNETLVAGGLFDVAGDSTAAKIARWDGTRWLSLGGGMEGEGNVVGVRALAEFRGELIAGGGFNTAGGDPANAVARWEDEPNNP